MPWLDFTFTNSGRTGQLITVIYSRSGTSLIFFCAWILEGDKGCAYKAARMSQRGGLSVVTSVSEHARAHGLNPRNIHTGAPTRYYRGIIQTYLYPSPMTADMTCDRLRYRLHDMSRSLALSSTAAPSQFSIPPFQANPYIPLSSFSRCHRR